MKIAIPLITLMMLLFSNCIRNEEQSDFFQSKNHKLKMMQGNWVIDKVFGNGMDLTDKLLNAMPDIKFQFTDWGADEKKTALLYRFTYSNSLVSGQYIIKGEKSIDQNANIYWFRSYYRYGPMNFFIPLLEKNQLDSLANNDTIVFDYYNSNYKISILLK